jgi:hypothetical protein
MLNLKIIIKILIWGFSLEVVKFLMEKLVHNLLNFYKLKIVVFNG